MTALTWIAQASIFNAALGGNAAANNLSQSIACAGPRGVTLAATINTNVAGVTIWKSINGGITWAKVNVQTIGWGGEFSLVWGGGTNWYAVASSGQYNYSNNDGTTWTSANTGSMAPQCNNAGAYDGSSTVMFQGATAGKMEWITASGTQPPTVTNGDLGVGNLGSTTGTGTMLWDGTNFVAINDDTAGANYKVFTAPSGFVQGSGPSWTSQATLAHPGSGLTNSSSGQGNFAFLPGVGYMTAWTTSGLKLATTYANILSQSLQTPLGVGSAYFVFGAGTRFFIGNVAGAMAESTDGATWTTDQPNFGVTGEKLALAVYDSLHNSYIIVGSAGSVSTGAIIPTFGHGIPASSPGVILTPNNNVNAPAGFGGDKWGANGGGITPVGGGTTGQTGYDKPIKITVSDGERAANYIISGGQNLAGAPVSVLGAESNAALSGQTIDSTLPQGDSTLGTVG